MTIIEQIKTIKKANKVEMQIAQKRWDSIAKPLKSLGLLEDAVTKMAGMVGANNVNVSKSALVIMCADHGVVSAGVTQTGSEVTAIVAQNFEKGETSVTVMAKECGTEVFPIDIGINNKGYKNKLLQPYKLCNRKINKGTKNIVDENAMTKEECFLAIQHGIDIVGQLKAQGYTIVATGEMGIGNTTPASAMAAVLMKKTAEETTGKGAGVSKEGFNRKINAVKKSIKRFYGQNPKGYDAFDVLYSLGGYDIAGMVGLFLGGAIHKVPVVVDGFISSISALVAIEVCPNAIDYIFASHVSKENFGEGLLKRLGLQPFINCNMCLGEGTGAVAVIPLFKMAVSIYKTMATFEEINVENYVDYEKEENK